MPTEDRFMDDRLLDIEEAAKLLCTSEDYLYHNWRRYPFAFKWSARQLRFSLKGIQAYIARKLEEQHHAEVSERGVSTR
jgi:predicted DNA-binding transcriptional regulator AlpA